MAELTPRAPVYVLVLPDGKEYSIPPGRLTVGRQADCDLIIADPLVSRRHADLYVRDGTLYLEDLRSANGTIVNGEPLEGERSVTGGDVIEFGDTKVTVRAEASPISIALRAITDEEAASGQVIGLDPPSAGYPAVPQAIEPAPIPPADPLQSVPEQPQPVAQASQEAPEPPITVAEPPPAAAPPIGATEEPPAVDGPPITVAEPPPLAGAEPPPSTARPPATAAEAPPQIASLAGLDVPAKAPEEAPSGPIRDSGSRTHETPAFEPASPQPAALPPISRASGEARLTIQASAPRAVPGGLAAEIALRGVLDIETADQFRDAVDPLVKAQVIFFTIALDEVEYIDSSGLGALVGLHREVKPRSGSVELERPQPAVRSVIELTRLDRVFKII